MSVQNTEKSDREKGSRNLITTLLAMIAWLVPAYALFIGTFNLDPKGNIEVSMLLGWAFTKSLIESTTMFLEELKSRIEKLVSSF